MASSTRRNQHHLKRKLPPVTVFVECGNVSEEGNLADSSGEEFEFRNLS